MNLRVRRSIDTPASAVNPIIMVSTVPVAMPAPASREPIIVPHLVIIGFEICLRS